MSFGGHLQTLRAEAGLSRAELARGVGVPASTLRNWEHDRGFPHLCALLRMAEALGVTIERIAEGVEDPVEEEAEAAEEKPRRGVNSGR
jgi:transcriptional regulator with XRE-family HTH domain